MTPQQLDELHTMPGGHEFTVVQALKRAGKEEAARLLDRYEERIAIICEGREATAADISAAWSNVLRIDDLMPGREKQADDETQNGEFEPSARQIREKLGK